MMLHDAWPFDLACDEMQCHLVLTASHHGSPGMLQPRPPHHPAQCPNPALVWSCVAISSQIHGRSMKKLLRVSHAVESLAQFNIFNTALEKLNWTWLNNKNLKSLKDGFFPKPGLCCQVHVCAIVTQGTHTLQVAIMSCQDQRYHAIFVAFVGIHSSCNQGRDGLAANPWHAGHLERSWKCRAH